MVKASDLPIGDLTSWRRYLPRAENVTSGLVRSSLVYGEWFSTLEVTGVQTMKRFLVGVCLSKRKKVTGPEGCECLIR